MMQNCNSLRTDPTRTDAVQDKKIPEQQRQVGSKLAWNLKLKNEKSLSLSSVCVGGRVTR
jgi:hypothetical protein